MYSKNMMWPKITKALRLLEGGGGAMDGGSGGWDGGEWGGGGVVAGNSTGVTFV